MCYDTPNKENTGRVVAMEILNNNNYAISNLIRSGKVQQIYSLLQTRTRDRQDERMITMERSLENLVEKGLIEASEAQKWKNR